MDLQRIEHVGGLLHQSENYYVVLIDLEGNYVYMNPFFQQRFHFVLDQTGPLSFLTTIHDEDERICLRAIERLKHDPSQKFRMRVRKVSQNRRGYFWTHWEVSALTDEQGALKEIACIGLDVIREDSINSRLLTYSRNIDNILNSITDGFFTLDKEWRVRKVNKLFEEVSGKSQAELVGKVFWDVYPEYQFAQNNEKYMQAIARKETFDFEIFSKRLRKWFAIKVYPSEDGLTVFFQDITAHKSQISEIMHRNEILSQIAKLQSHQIRRPVATIIGLSQLFDKSEMSEENLELLDLLHKTTKELDEVIHKIVRKANLVIRETSNSIEKNELY